MYLALGLIGVFCLLVGYAVGWYETKKKYKINVMPAGYLLYNNEDENEDPYLFLDLDIEPEQIMKEKYVVFETREVVTSQK